MVELVGISSSYFATRGFSIYDSVKQAKELGFKTVELGAAHKFEKDVWKTLLKIKSDFSGMNFTVHGLFPPLEERGWFNASLGLTTKNREILNSMFKAASIVEAKLVGIHPGMLRQLGWGEEIYGFNMPSLGEEIEREGALQKFKEILWQASRLSNETGIKFAVENIPNVPAPALLQTSEDFESMFSEFLDVFLLFDFGHAMLEGKVEEFLQLNERAAEMHLHYTKPTDTIMDDHNPFPEKFDFSQLKKIKQLNKIPLIFEHGNNVSEKEILQEKKQLERFLKSFF